MKEELLNRSYGLVFEGGGAKGAYEIGVWKALNELGVRVTAVVGTSVGALNGVLFAQGDFEEGMRIWENIKYSTVLNVEDEVMEKMAAAKWSQLSFQEASKQFREIIRNRGLDITPLKALLDEMIDEEVLRSSDIDFGLATFNLSDFKPIEVMIEDIEPGKVAGYLLASAYLPVFRSERIFGKIFLDGGFSNAVPTSMLVERGYKDIIEVRLQGLGIERRYDEEEVNLVRIAAREDLGRLLEFDHDKARKNIALGYLDAMKVFMGLEGESYYIQSEQKEAYYLKQFIRISKRKVYSALTNIGNQYLIRRYESKERMVCEELIPLVARKLRKTREATYKELYFTLMERLATALEVDRLRIYTIEELKVAIKLAWEALSREESEELLRIDNMIELAIALGV